MWKISLPLRVQLNKKRQFPINLNEMRNSHYQVLNKAKRNFTSVALGLIQAEGVPKLERCTLEYHLYPRTKQLCDVGNICPAMDKFFSDSLVVAGILPDDNYNHIPKIVHKFGHIDRENPRVDVIIRSLDHQPTQPSPTKRSSKEMQIKTLVTMTQKDLNEALRDFLAKHNFTVNEETNITIVEGDNGEYSLSFSPEIGSAIDSAPVATKRKKKTKLEPKEAMAAVKKAHQEPEATKEESEPEDDEEEVTPETEKSQDEPEEEEAEEGTEEPTKGLRTVTTGPGAPSTPAPGKGIFAGFTRPKN